MAIFTIFSFTIPTLKSTNCNLPLHAFSNSRKYTIHKNLDYKTCENLYENRRVELGVSLMTLARKKQSQESMMH